MNNATKKSSIKLTGSTWKAIACHPEFDMLVRRTYLVQLSKNLVREFYCSKKTRMPPNLIKIREYDNIARSNENKSETK